VPACPTRQGAGQEVCWPAFYEGGLVWNVRVLIFDFGVFSFSFFFFGPAWQAKKKDKANCKLKSQFILFPQECRLILLLCCGLIQKKGTSKISRTLLVSVTKKTALFLQNEILWMKFTFSFYELMPEHQSIRKKWKDRHKSHF
jgi:hypothetical protein